MSKSVQNNSISHNLASLAATFYRLGWLGFWAQALLGLIPIFLLIVVLFFPSRLNQGSVDLGDILGFASLLFLLFTIYWFYRYTQLGTKLEDSQLRPPKAKVSQCLWIGLIANVACMSCAVLVAMGEVLSLLYIKLSLPRGGATIYSPMPGATVLDPAGQVIVPLDLIGLLAMISSISAGLVGVIITLWLLHRVIR